MSDLDIPVGAFKKGQPLSRINHRTLRQNLAAITERVSAAHGAVEVINGRSTNPENDAILVARTVFEELIAEATRSDLLRRNVVLLLAAVKADIAIPSATLDSLGINVPVDLDSLQAFQAVYPMTATHNEYGEPLKRTRLNIAETSLLPEVEDEEPLEFLDDEDGK